MGIRDWLARQGKASIIGLPASEQPDKPLERSFDDANLLTTFRDDAWPYILANKIGEQASQAPLMVGVWKGKGTERQFEATPDHPLQALFDAPNPQMDGGEFIHLLMLFMELVGHEPIEVVKSKGGKPAELWLHNPGPWRIVANADGSVRGYLYLQANEQDVRWRPDQMTYLRWPNPNDRWYGQGRLAAVRNEVMAEEYAAIRDKNFEKRYGVPPGILTSEMPLGEPVAKELQKRWEQAVGGYQNAGRIAVLGSKTTYQAVSQSAKDSQSRETRLWRVEALAAAFGIPLPLIRMEGATFSNAEEARAEFWEGTLQPRLNRIARMLTARLMPILGAPDRVLAFDYSQIEALGENDLTAAQTAKAHADLGAVTVDEVRARINLPPHENPEIGKRLLVPSSVTLKSDEDITAPPEPPVLPGAPAPKPAPPKMRKARGVDRELVLGPVRSAYARDLGAYFDAQLAALTPLIGKTGDHDAQRGALKDDVDLLERIIAVLRAKRFVERLRKISEPPVASALTYGAADAADLLGIEASFNLAANESAIARLTTHLNLLDAGITNTTTADVRRVLEGALRNGLSNAEVRAALSDLFTNYQDWRADMISRTETAAAYNLGAAGQYRDAGVALVSVVDGDGDAECAAANGATWTIEEMEADPLAHPNCTRTFIPQTERLLADTGKGITVNVAPPAITLNITNEGESTKMQTVIDRNADGDFIGYHEEPLPVVMVDPDAA